jgi:hypothetical protein
MSKPHPNGALYCDLMEFIKWRIEAVQETIHLVRTKQHHLDNRLAAEFCLLQLRMCCELLAIGCIAIHTDVPQTKRFEKMWNAEAIMTIFEELKPDFFPKPVIDKIEEDGSISQFPVEGALAQSDLLQMYNLFGRLLHTGTFKKYKQSTTQAYDFSILEDFIAKLVKLLNKHIYYLEEYKQMIHVIMHNVKDGRVWLQALEGRKTPDASPSSDTA